MIIFDGFLNESCIEKLTKLKKKKESFLTRISLIVITILLLICLYGYFTPDKEILTYISGGCFVAYMIFMISFGIIKGKAEERVQKDLHYDEKIIIRIEGETLYWKTDTSERQKSLQEVKRIVDYGEWYMIIFYKEGIAGAWACQKDLLKAGTLEEFEKMFSEKLTKK